MPDACGRARMSFQNQAFRLCAFVLLSGLALASPAFADSCTDGPKFDDNGVTVFDYGTQSWGDISNIGIQYNPTNIAQLARFCLNMYRKDHQQQDWSVVVAQIHWLRNNAIFVGPDLAGYQHHFSWNYGLKPGWYSGSAQSSAIRVLIEYFRETHDTTVVHLIRSLKNFMMLSVEKGGTLQTTPEGGAWIEEFPSDPPSLALGGDIDGLLALRAVADAFDDSGAKRDFQRVYSSLQTSLKQYDSGNWFYTDRYSARPPPLAHDMYGAAFVRLFMQLFDMTHDPLMLSTSLRWGSFYEEGSRNSHGTMKLDKDTYRLSGGLPKNEMVDLLKGNIADVATTPISVAGFGADKLFDGNIDTYFSADKNGLATVLIKLASPASVNTLRVGLYNKELYPTELALEIKADGAADFRPISYENVNARRYLYYHFDETRAKEIRITASKFSAQDRLVISDIALGKMDWTDLQASNCSRTTDPVRVDDSAFKLSIDAPKSSSSGMVVIYRFADSNDALAKSPWQWEPLPLDVPHQITQSSNLYQFRVLCTQAAGERGWKNFKVVTPANKIIYQE